MGYALDMFVCHCCLVAKSCRILCNTWTVACQAPLSMRFPRQEYWSGLPFPSLGDLPDPEIKLKPPTWQADSFPQSQGKPSLSLLTFKRVCKTVPKI